MNSWNVWNQNYVFYLLWSNVVTFWDLGVDLKFCVQRSRASVVWKDQFESFRDIRSCCFVWLHIPLVFEPKRARNIPQSAASSKSSSPNPITANQTSVSHIFLESLAFLHCLLCDAKNTGQFQLLLSIRKWQAEISAIVSNCALYIYLLSTFVCILYFITFPVIYMFIG